MKTALRFCEFAFITLGVALLSVYVFFRMHAWFFQAYDSWSFDQVLKDRTHEADASRLPEGQRNTPNLETEPDLANPRNTTNLETEPEVANYRDWAPARALAHEKSLKRQLRGIVGRLLIPALDLNVMVLEGTDPWTLNRAVGHIESTALPGRAGNVGISAHRDGYFRNLGHIARGDEISILTPEKTYRYAVESTRIVNPGDIEVLAPSDQPVLTLVTCFPFYFVGDAPQRFIVKAQLVR
jgi:LPXTG-site transpeptidase (sortase) family protein